MVEHINLFVSNNFCRDSVCRLKRFVTVAIKVAKMNKVDGSQTVDKIFKLFFFFGIWQHDNEECLRKAGKKCFYLLFFPLYPIFLVVHATLCEEKNEIIYSLESSLLTAVIYLKLWYLLFKKEEICAFLCKPTVLEWTHDEEILKTVNGKIEKFTKFLRAYDAMIFVSISLSIIVARLPPLTTGKERLPMFLRFLWEDSEVIYWTLYVFLSLSVMLCFLVNHFVLLLWYIMLNYSLECQLLGNELKHLGKGGKNNENLKIQSKHSYVEDLVALIKIHQDLIG